MEPWKLALIAAVPGLISLVLLLFGFRSLWRKRTIENVPTSKVAGVFIGLSEVKGRAESPHPLRSHLAECECVYYRYTIQEEWERWETEHYTDSKGNRQTRRVRKSGWTTVASHEERPPFFIRDETGALRIVPDGAEIEPESVFSRTVSRLDPLYYGKGPGGGIADSTGRRSFSESAIRTGKDLYVIGTARPRDDVAEPEIAYAEDQEMFVISTRGEDAVKRGYGLAAFFQLLFGALFAGACPFLYRALALHDAGAALRAFSSEIAIAGAVYGAIVAVYYLQLLYNGLMSVRNRVESAWSQIEIQLQRRQDLIPNLVACAKGYAAHEQALERAIADARVEALRGAQGGMPSAEAALAAVALANAQTGALRGLYGIVERYPELKADAGFARLMDELSRTEQRIALARGFFNESVTAYNDRIGTLPDLLVAKLRGLERAAWFEIDDFERAPVSVAREMGKAAGEAGASGTGTSAATSTGTRDG
jgi:hypothetical protein